MEGFAEPITFNDNNINNNNTNIAHHVLFSLSI